MKTRIITHFIQWLICKILEKTNINKCYLNEAKLALKESENSVALFGKLKISSDNQKASVAMVILLG